MAKTIRWVAIVLLMLGVCLPMFGQATASGTIQGTVTDKTKALVADATVVVTNKGTGASRTVNSNASGYFRLEQMPVGTYTVKVSKAGFQSLLQVVDLLVNQTVTANAELKPGSTTEVVEVTGQAPLIDEGKMDVSQEITPEQIQDLPMIGRDVANLAYLAPGVKAADSYDPTKNRYAILSVNGSTGRNVNVTVNGIDNKDNTVGGPVMQLPLEAVEEYAISTQRFSAANGRSEGAAINLITKSGTNNYHGSVFGFFRDQALNATPALASDNPPYSRQFFGGSIGGPVIKDKIFGFFAIERQREHTSLTEDPTLLAELNLAQSIGAQPAAVIPTPFFEYRYNGRMDFRFSDKENAYISYSSQSNNSLNDQSDGKGDLTGGNFTTNHLQVANFTLASALTNSFINTFTFGFQYWNNLIDSGIRVPYITFPSGAWFGTNVNVPQQSYQHKFQFKDDLAKTFGNHALKWGVDYLYEPSLGGYFESNSTLEIDFNQDPSQIVGLANGYATPGLVTGMSYSVGESHFSTPNGGKMLGLYFQDDWKATRRLTLDLGLRYDHDYNLFGEGWIPVSRTYQELKAIGSPYAAKIPHEDSLDFSPRIGFAFDMNGNGKHLLRGGYGLYYGQTFQNIPLFMEQQANTTIYQGVFSIGQGNNCAANCVPGTNILLQNWRYGVDPMPTLPPASGDLNPGSTGRLMDPNFRNPYSEQFNIGYQWAVSSNSVFEAEYIHELGLHEDKTININPTLASLGGARPLSAAFAAAGVPVLGRIMDEQAINRSRYDGMNLSFRRRMSNHLELIANYTLSRSLAYSGSAASFRSYETNPLNPLPSWNLGPTPQDELHHITLSGLVQLPWGFTVAPIMQFGSARPYNLTEGYDVYGFGSGDTQPLIVNNSAPTDYTAYRKQNFASTTAAAAAANACLAAGQCHEVQFDPVRGDAFFQLDMRVSKNIKFGENRNLALMFQAFNLTNKLNYGNDFGGSASSSTFMQPVGYINPTSSTTPRAFVGEFGVRFSF